MHRVKTILASLVLAVLGVSIAHAQSPLALSGMEAYNRGDIATAYKLLREAADANDPEALVNLGYLYARGQSVRADQKEALYLYQRSADQGSSEGMNALGYKYLNGTGVAIDPVRAVHWFCLAIAKGNPRAMNNLAIVLNDGQHLMQDEAEARDLWEQSANLGHINSMMNLGLSYLQGKDRDQAKGSQWVFRAANAGQPDAQRLLRANGYHGSLPKAYDQAAMMIPAPHNEAGRSKTCGAAIS